MFRFELSSYTLHVDETFLPVASHPQIFANVISTAINHHQEYLIQAAHLTDRTLSHRLIDVAASCFHEKRHFLDTVLTNYGALKHRHFERVYRFNQFITGRSASRLGVPLPLNVDPYARRVHGLDSEDEAVKWYCENIRNRLRYDLLEHERDRRVPFDFSGRGILEALGSICEFNAVEEVFGTDALGEWQGWRGAERNHQMTYRWAELVGIHTGIVGREDFGDGVVALDTRLLNAVMIAALMTRGWDQETDIELMVRTGHPWPRMSQLLDALQNSMRRPGELTSKDIWMLVNASCETLFGRTVLQELDADIEIEEIARRTMPTDDVLDEAYEDLSKLRNSFRDILAKKPEQIFDATVFARELVPRLRPLVVHNNLQGFPISELDSTATTIVGDEEAAYQVMYADEPTHGESKLHNVEAWIDIAARSADARVLLFGEYGHGVIGPEVARVAQSLDALGVTPVFPKSVAPLEVQTLEHVLAVHGLDGYVCVGCHDFLPIASLRYFEARAFSSRAPGVVDPRGRYCPVGVCEQCLVQIVGPTASQLYPKASSSGEARSA